MSKQKLWVCIVSSLVLIGALGLFLNQNSDKKDEDAYQDVLISYLEAMKNGSEEAVEFATFPNDDIRDAFLSSPLYIVDYEIEVSETINEKLKAYTILIEDNLRTGIFRRIYYFVGNYNEGYTVFGNVKYVPEELRNGLDISKYSYTDDNLLGEPEFEIG